MEEGTIRPKEGLRLRQIKEQYMIVDACEGHVDMSNVYTLNPTAARLWKRMEGGCHTPQELAEWLCGVYAIDMATALKDTERQLSEWESYGLVSRR